jgi:hypothetical protein
LDAALTGNAAALLARETHDYEQRVRPWARDPNVYLAPARAFYVYAAATGGAALVLGVVIAVLATR